LPRPRDLDSPGYLERRDEIFSAMGMSLRIGGNESETNQAEKLAERARIGGDLRLPKSYLVGDEVTSL
jgi:hypothetical protein